MRVRPRLYSAPSLELQGFFFYDSFCSSVCLCCPFLSAKAPPVQLVQFNTDVKEGLLVAHGNTTKLRGVEHFFQDRLFCICFFN